MKIVHLLRYASRNLTRNLRRSVLTVLATALAVLFMTFGNSFLNGLISDVIEIAVQTSGHLVIQTKDFTRHERTLPLDRNIAEPGILMTELRKIPHVRMVSPRIQFGAIFQGPVESLSAMGTAVEPSLEKDFLRFDEKLFSGSDFSGTTNEILLGVELAKKLKIRTGEWILLVTKNSYGSITGMKCRIQGILDLGVYERNRSFFMPYAQASRLLKTGNEPQKIIAVLDSLDALGSVHRRFQNDPLIRSAGLDVLRVDRIGVFQSMFPVIMILARLIYGLLLLAAVITIANTMLMTVMERTAEIGVLQALGAKRHQVGAAVVLESGMIGLIGSVIGVCIGTPVTLYFQKTGVAVGENISRGMFVPIQSVLHPQITPELVILIGCLGVAVSLLAGLFPAIHAVRMDPAVAIRTKEH